MPRGGARQGKPGVSHLNRTDLNVAKLPAVAAPGQVYGQAGQQIAAQQAMPMGTQPTPSTPAPEGPQVLPGSLGALDRPSERPGEPLTHGALGGPGPGAEILPQGGNAAQFRATRDLIGHLAQTTPSPALATLAMYARRGL